MHVPPGTHGPERCKTFVYSKFGRAVNTHGYIRKITIIINIVPVSLKKPMERDLLLVTGSS